VVERVFLALIQSRYSFDPPWAASSKHLPKGTNDDRILVIVAENGFGHQVSFALDISTRQQSHGCLKVDSIADKEYTHGVHTHARTHKGLGLGRLGTVLIHTSTGFPSFFFATPLSGKEFFW
jgi:hypothetical protein